MKNTLRVGHRGPVGRKTTQKPPQNTKKWKKIVKKRLFSRFGHFGQNSDFSRKKSKTGIFFDITKPPLAQIYRVCDGYSGLCGVREGYFGGFRQKNEKNMTVTGGVQSVLGMSWGRLGHFFDLKTPKKHFQKCQICPKQVGMDSQATFGVYLCQRRLCDVKKYPGF